MKRFEIEDIALLASIVVAGTAVVVDDMVNSTTFKVLKIIALLLSLGLAAHRIRAGRPYVRDIVESDWVAVGKEYEVVVPRSMHKRGRFPIARCLTKGDGEGYAENFLGATVSDSGDVRVKEPMPASFRIEIRKS